MPPSNLEILALEATPIGTLCLRRRALLSSPGETVTEITLDHQLLMSSRFTASEEALAREALEMHGGEGLHVLVGGLGLGYTAWTALSSPRVRTVEAVELLPQVIEWLERGWLPLSGALGNDERFSVRQGDAFALLAGPPGSAFDLVLIDIDHAPDDRLGGADDRFYAREGLRLATRHLATDGVLGTWSSAESPSFERSLRAVFGRVRVEPVTFVNDLVGESRTDWLYLAS
jgi:spermidine synthase